MIGIHSPVATAIKLGATCAIASALYLQPYRVMMFVGSSMAPTYASHTVLLTEPVRPEQLTRGMVVIINMDNGPIVKRIAYLPGDKILQAKLGGAWFDLIYVRPIDSKALKKLQIRYHPVPAGEVYVLGDNQIVSQDSRSFGCVSVDRIQRRLVDQRPYARFEGWHGGGHAVKEPAVVFAPKGMASKADTRVVASKKAVEVPLVGPTRKETERGPEVIPTQASL